MGLNGIGGSRWGLVSLGDPRGAIVVDGPRRSSGQKGMSSAPSWMAGSTVMPASGSASWGLGPVLDGDVLDLECELLVAALVVYSRELKWPSSAGFLTEWDVSAWPARLPLSVACPAYLLGAMHLQRFRGPRQWWHIRLAAPSSAWSATAQPLVSIPYVRGVHAAAGTRTAGGAGLPSTSAEAAAGVKRSPTGPSAASCEAALLTPADVRR
jgi:hypothetical protein